MMDILPSYNEATTRLDWLSLVAPYVPASAWTCCCLVDCRFYSHFASRLWRDPLVTIRQLGLHPNDDLAWYKRFLHKYVASARPQTRCMVKSLDFRAFALSVSGLYSTEASERAISESFKALPQLFPDLTCLLVDGHPELDPSSLATAREITTHPLELLDLACCGQELTPKLFCPQLFHHLVYLDISYIPGSLRSAIQSSLNPGRLPELRVLKVQGREMDDTTAQLLFQTFGLQLWSIDLSDNKLTDDSVDALLAHCFSSISFHNDAHFEVEGKVVVPKNLGSHAYGPFEFIQESSHSASFTHPERYLADPPIYAQRADQAELQEWQTACSDGISPPRLDDASSVKEMLLEHASSQTSTTPRQLIRNLHLPRGGLTHLYLNRNSFTANARSVGPVIEQLTSFLDLASSQQETMRQARIDMNGRHTTMLSGLRRLRLELDPEFPDDGLESSTARDLDYDKLLDPGDDDFGDSTFSFFKDTKRTKLNQPSSGRKLARDDSCHANTEQYSQWKSGRLKSSPYSDTKSHYINYYEEASNSWTGNVFSVPVWIGPGTIGPHPAVNEYMWNLQDAKLRNNVGPATPDHVAAGVPALTYIFYAAWDAMIFPKNLAIVMYNLGTDPLRDVAAAIKEYRVRTKGTPHHWDGKIELVRTNRFSQCHASQYWR
ncbi:hypothetical protein FHL15_001596 [Xylaria flabelliformis]|uniref:Uncharacterized protein n=1 Tax=Xylaria flabelliformis TaxID=2512241 RepID=A0A553IAT7_9PEZI|nr:hypothetical protein FHL15_001596 [Xylaria flabelliformis]